MTPEPPVTVGSTATPLLEVDDLRTTFHTPRGAVRAVDGVSLRLSAGETIGVVGESGSGKSVLGRTIMGLISAGPATEVQGTVRIGGRDVHALAPGERRRLWGPEVAMVFQDPMTSLNPTKRIGTHLTETLRLHLGLRRGAAADRAIELLVQVGIPEPRRRVRQFPHELSGGMRQRVVIALALACSPKLLIADEPTTALDVTVQKQILDLLGTLAERLDMATILISHDLGVIAGRTDRVAVMYAGRIAETAATAAVFEHPLHPYTDALIGSIPRLSNEPHAELRVIDGNPPDMSAPPPGCRFAPRCVHAFERCREEAPPPHEPLAYDARHSVACHAPLLPAPNADSGNADSGNADSMNGGDD
ncbi:peptide ABC transporter ATP-binding protein [Sphaerimonospora thailandensis]|uniref:Peptide ABC transporter ATP-binding protein n=2 Tax=Sphaerimonospora thailandensis TaxID=795644 RepID=A0A8J3RBM0_9ACTN|nr:peptide ABC transporter ATP-binding protein [Sphaerimonospora thailandensis]